jgi:esterase/lipase
MSAFAQSSVTSLTELTQIDQYLYDQESVFDDLIEGTEKGVHWANQVGEKTEYSIIYIHGFSASRGEVAPLPEIIAKRLNANIYYTRLTGHGRSNDAMAEASMQDWLNDTEQAYKIGSMIGDKIIVLGTSTGGTLTAWLAMQDFADSLHALIMISSNFGVRDKKAYLLPYRLGMALAKMINGPYHSFDVANPLHAKYWTEKYPLEAVIPMLELVRHVNSLDFSKLSLPHLNIYSDQDEVIEPSAIRRYHRQLGGSKNRLVAVKSESDCGHHVLAGDACSPSTTIETADLIMDFLNGLN